MTIYFYSILHFDFGRFVTPKPFVVHSIEIFEMSAYTEEYLKNKLIEKLEAVHVVSEIAARTDDVYKRRD